jgi:hypothetical protein
MDILKSLGIGQKSSYQKERDASPVLSAMFERRQPTLEEIREQERLNRAAGVTFPRYQGNISLSSGEKLRNIGGLTYVVPADSPAASINTTGIDLSADIRMPDSPIPPMPADGMGGYSQGGVFSPPAAPMRVERPPERPAPFNPEQQIDGSANRMQDIIPVKPNVSGMLDNLIEREFARAKGRENAPSLPLRRSNSMPQARSVMPQRGPEDNTGLFYTLPDATMPTGVGGQLEPLVPDMFGGQLPMPSPTEYNSDPLGINDIPIQSNPLAELPLGTMIDEQGNLVNAQTGAIITPNYQPDY